MTDCKLVSGVLIFPSINYVWVNILGLGTFLTPDKEDACKISNIRDFGEDPVWIYIFFKVTR